MSESKNQLDRNGLIHFWATIKAALDKKVDKIDGKGLSSNDYTTAEKRSLASLIAIGSASKDNSGYMSSADKIKLDGIEENANKYVHPTYMQKTPGLYRIGVDASGHVSSADKMTSAELEAEGVSPANHTHDINDLIEPTMIVPGQEPETSGVFPYQKSASDPVQRMQFVDMMSGIKKKTDTYYFDIDKGNALETTVTGKADKAIITSFTIPTDGWLVDSSVTGFENYIDISITGLTAADVVNVDVAPSSSNVASVAQFANTETQDGFLRLRARNVPSAEISAQWYIVR